MKNDILKEAIAEAKAVRETAMANAKLALEEAFAPKIQSMLSAKLSEEGEYEDDMSDMEMEPEAPVAPAPEAPVAPAPEVPVEPEFEDDMEDDMELEAIIRELEGEDDMDMEDDMYMEGDMDMEDDMDIDSIVDEMYEEEYDDMEFSDEEISEIISALTEEEYEEEEMTEGDYSDSYETEAELEEAYTVIKYLRSKLNEVNLLNAKLLYTNKLFRNYELSENKKMEIVENFDLTDSIREIQLVYSTLAKQLKTGAPKRTRVHESFASDSQPSTKSNKSALNENTALTNRWKKLITYNR